MKRNYRILLRPREGQSPELECASVQDRLPSVPGISSRSKRLFHFGEEDEHGVMTIRLSLEGSADATSEGSSSESASPKNEIETSAGAMRSIDVTIPRPWVKQRGPQVFAIVFMMQGWTGWEVYDPQIESTLERETVLQGMVAMRQIELEKQGMRVPRPRLKDDSK